MIKYKVWDKTRPLFPQAGGKWEAQKVFEQYGWTENEESVVLITEVGGILGSIDNLEVLKQNYGVEEDDIDLAIKAIEDIINAPVIQVPSAEERMAAALEFQNLLSMPV